MKLSVQLELIGRYPNLFRLEATPLGPGMGFTLRVGAAGWFDVLDRFCTKLSCVLGNSPELGTCQIVYIKEKIGELRIYCDSSDLQVTTLIDEARQESARTCQVCGSAGKLEILPPGVAATLCRLHAERLARPRGRNSPRSP